MSTLYKQVIESLKSQGLKVESTRRTNRRITTVLEYGDNLRVSIHDTNNGGVGVFVLLGLGDTSREIFYDERNVNSLKKINARVSRNIKKAESFTREQTKRKASTESLLKSANVLMKREIKSDKKIKIANTCEVGYEQLSVGEVVFICEYGGVDFYVTVNPSKETVYANVDLCNRTVNMSIRNITKMIDLFNAKPGERYVIIPLVTYN